MPAGTRICRVLSVLFALAFFPNALRAADTNVLVDWSQTPRTAGAFRAGLNLYDGADPVTTGDARYVSNLSLMQPGIVRLHNGALCSDLNSERLAWVSQPNSPNYAWSAAKINAALANLNKITPAPALLINIPGWPQYLDDGSGNLKADKYDEYAAFCAQLVQIVNKSGTGNYALYWEPTNEKDGTYASHFSDLTTIWKKCAAAMKAADPTIRVGGLAFANPYAYANVQAFITQTAGIADFISIHAYPFTGNSTGTSTADIYNGADSLNYIAGVTLAAIQGSAKPDTPLFLDEYNINGNPDPAHPETRMTTNVSAVFDALVQMQCASIGVAGTCAWNEMDGWYGKTGGDYTLRPAAYFYNLINRYGAGDIAGARSDRSEVRVFATRSGSSAALILVNRDSVSHSVACSFTGWAAPGTAANFPKSLIYSGGLLNGTVTYSSLTSGVSLASNSVTVIPFSNVTFTPHRLLINAGGTSDATDPTNLWLPDTDYVLTGGTNKTSISTNAITTTGVNRPAPQSVYQTNRQGMLQYVIPNMAANQYHRVRLHFAETVWYAPGQRRFDVAINGVPFLTDFDIFAAASGSNRAVVVENPFVIADAATNTITISLTQGAADVPILSGIEIDNVPPASPNLFGTLTNAPAALDLTAAGTLDWTHWGLGAVTNTDFSADRKTGANLIGNPVRYFGGTDGQATDAATAFTWSDGSPTANSTGTTTGIMSTVPFGTGSGFAFAVPADVNFRVLKLSLGTFNGDGQLTAHISDGTSPDLVVTIPGISYRNRDSVYTLYYRANTPGATLTLIWRDTTNLGSYSDAYARLFAAALAPVAPLPAALQGTVQFEGIPDLSAVVSPTGNLSLTFRSPNTLIPLYTRTAAVTPVGAGSPNGTFNLTDAPTGTFDVAIQGNKTLRRVVPAVSISGMAVLDPVTLAGGNTTFRTQGDNVINFDDFLILLDSFGTTYDPNVDGSGDADFNGDGNINFDDFLILLNNFGSQGDP